MGFFIFNYGPPFKHSALNPKVSAGYSNRHGEESHLGPHATLPIHELCGLAFLGFIWGRGSNECSAGLGVV